MKDTPIKLGFILHSSDAFDLYMDATGEVPPKMPEGKNTLVTPFVYQTGFSETPEETANGDEASGLGAVVALNAPLARGRNAIDTYLDEMLHEGE